MSGARATHDPQRARAGALELAPFEEPHVLRQNLLELLAQRGATARPEIVRRLAARAWAKWRGELEAHAMTGALLRALAQDYDREIWLWVLGDRSWEQMLAGLRGRILRRVCS